MRFAFVLIAALLTIPVRAAVTPQGAQPCRAPAPTPSREPNIFTEEQENDLGDIIAEKLAGNFRVIDDDAIANELRRIGNGLVAHLPETKLKYQFALVDLGDANAFVLPGGRIFVSRKLISLAQSEDELAGVIGHELGHVVARQKTIEMTKQLRDVLNVTSVTTREDIFDKYTRMMDNAAKKPGAFRQSGGQENEGQIEADRIGLFAIAAAGYEVAAHARLFDRVVGTNGKTGGFFSNLFGTTSPNAQRLGEMIKTSAKMAPGCTDPHPSMSLEAFQAWQAAVVSYTGLGRQEHLHGVVSQTRLEPPLPAEMRRIRFSQDGRYLLTQDDGGITVLTHQPLAPLFRINVQDVDHVLFTPDSEHVVLATSDLRVERWDIATKKLDRAHEVAVRAACVGTALSPTGEVLACYDEEAGLELIDVNSNAEIFKDKRFYQPNILEVYQRMLTGEPYLCMDFSTDGRIFAAGHEGILQGELVTFAYDLRAKAPLPVKGDAKKLMTGWFAFIGPEEFVGRNRTEPLKSGRANITTGVASAHFLVGPGAFEVPTQGAFVFLRPYQKFAIGVMDLAQAKVTKGNAGTAFDIFGDEFAAERGNGELGLYGMATNALKSSAILPRANIGRLRSVDVSPDFAWLASAQRVNGAIWDLRDGHRMSQTPGYRAGRFVDQQTLIADFPKTTDQPRRLLKIDVHAPGATFVANILGEAERVDTNGPLIMTRRGPTQAAPNAPTTVELRDARQPVPLWNRLFKDEVPLISWNYQQSVVLLIWRANTKAAKEDAKSDPAFAKRLAEGDVADYSVVVCDLKTGDVRQRLFVETNKGSFSLTDVFSAGDWLALGDDGNRLHIYNLKTGEAVGSVFGGSANGAATPELFATANAPGQLAVYDFATLKRRDEFAFAHDISFARFSADGKRLFVLTNDQVAYVLDIAKPGEPGR
jgi:WD40 repeat protein